MSCFCWRCRRRYYSPIRDGNKEYVGINVCTSVRLAQKTFSVTTEPFLDLFLFFSLQVTVHCWLSRSRTCC